MLRRAKATTWHTRQRSHHRHRTRSATRARWRPSSACPAPDSSVRPAAGHRTTWSDTARPDAGKTARMIDRYGQSRRASPLAQPQRAATYRHIGRCGIVPMSGPRNQLLRGPSRRSRILVDVFMKRRRLRRRPTRYIPSPIATTVANAAASGAAPAAVSPALTAL